MVVAVVSQMGSGSNELSTRGTSETRTQKIRIVEGVNIRPSEPQLVVVPQVPPEERVARAAKETVIRRTIQQAIGAEVKRNKRMQF